MANRMPALGPRLLRRRAKTFLSGSQRCASQVRENRGVRRQHREEGFGRVPGPGNSL